MNRLLARMIIVLTLLSICIFLTAQVTVTGRVIGSDAPNGIAGANVSLTFEERDYNTETGADGSFTLNNVQGSAEGDVYLLLITTDGYAAHRRDLRVQQENINLQNIRLNELAWAPRNVQAELIDEQDLVEVQWLAPEATEGEWLSWSEPQFADIGTAAPAEIDWVIAHRFTPFQYAELGVIAGMYITSVRFFPMHDLDYTVRIYRGGSDSPYNPGDLIYSQLLSDEDVEPGEWNQVDLDYPAEILLDREIWIGVATTTSAAEDPPRHRPFGIDEGPAVVGFGDILFFGGVWRSMAVDFNVDRNLCLMAFAGFLGGGGRSIPLNPLPPVQEEVTFSQTPSGLYDGIVPTVVNHDRSASRRRNAFERYYDFKQNRELEGYQIYRVEQANLNNPDLWVYLDTVEAAELDYDDVDWENAGEGRFFYAVRAVYTGEVYSGFSLTAEPIFDEEDQFDGGDGSEFEPWLIRTAHHLNNVREYLGFAHNDKHFEVVADIDLSVFQEWAPIAINAANSFNGTFDGGGFSISNLTIDANSDYQGLFGYISGASVFDVHLVDVDIVANRYVGALAGRSENQTVIRNCSSSGTVLATSEVGGLVGQQHNSRLERSFSHCNVTARTQMIGGLLGHNHVGAVVSECYATGIVTGGGSWYTGGLVGYNQGTNNVQCGTMIEKSYSTGFVTGPGLMIGGLVGRNFGSIVSNCYSTASVLSFGSFSGCLIGQHCCTSTLIHSFAVGPGDLGCAGRGGLMCQQQTSVTTNSYWDRQTTGQNTSAQGAGYTTVQMTQQASFVGWDFEDIWTIEEGLSYPSFRWDEDRINIPGPSGLQAEAGNQFLDLTWNALAVNNDGYRVYLDGGLVNEDELIGQNQYRVTGLTNMQQYTIFVTAVLTRDEQQYETLPSATVFGTPFGIDGEGTEESPYLIRTAEELNIVVRNNVGNPNVYFEQRAHIDLEDIDNWAPIGIADNDGAAFRGNYNGAGFEIRNMTITGNDQYRALFGYTRSGAVLRNIHIVDANVRAQLRGGTLVSNARDTQIIDCSATGLLTPVGNWGHGGLIGEATGTTNVTRCWADVNIPGTTQTMMGGLIGRVTGPGQISESFALGNVSSTSTSVNSDLGGLIGTITSGSVINCYAMGDVSSTQNGGRMGGLIGNNQVAVTNSFSTGRVTSTGPEVGGLIGRNTAAVTNSYWNIELSGQATSSGGVGRNTRQMLAQDTYENWDFTVEPVWSIDDDSLPYLAWEGEEASGHSFPPLGTMPASVLVAEIAGNFDRIDLTWDAPSIGEPIGYRVFRDGNLVSGPAPIEDTAYQDRAVNQWTPYIYFVRAVYTIDEELVESENSNTFWIIINQFAGGDGTPDNPYLIDSPQHLQGMMYDLTAHYRQVRDVDLQGINFRPLGHGANTDSFTGTLDGGGLEIRNLRAEGNPTTTFYRGLFGYTGNGAVLKNINIVDMNFSCGHQGGGLVGRVNGSTIIENCSATGTLNGTGNFIFGGLVGYAMGDTHIRKSWTDVNLPGNGYRTGGLVGEWRATGQISESYALGNISCGSTTANLQLGGLVGAMFSGEIVNCYARGDVTSTQNRARVGGLVGENSGRPVTESYSTGRVTSTGDDVGGLIGFNTGEISASYWDMDTSGIAGEGHGEGRRTAEMTHPYGGNTYVRWDFEETWIADTTEENDGYPLLRAHFVPTELGVPQVNIVLVHRAGVAYARLDWEAIEYANSYKIYASNDPERQFNQWEEIDHVGSIWYEDEVVLEEDNTMFYRVVASTQNAPGGRRDARRRRELSREIAR